ncbi:MAG: CHASE2 domain-containing protein [Synechococcales bacterium]|nr:CHASE2 domain-containing protein [Synechococcales bacterium]
MSKLVVKARIRQSMAGKKWLQKLQRISQPIQVTFPRQFSNLNLLSPELLFGVLVIGLVVAARMTGLLQFLELVVFDTYLRSRPAEPTDSRVVIITLDDQDIKTLSRYPASDRELAELLKQVQAQKPAAIGLDMAREVAYYEGKAELDAVLRSSPNLIGVQQALLREGQTRVQAPSVLPPEQVGIVDSLRDANVDNQQRRVLLGTWDLKEDYQYSLGIRLTKLYLQQRHIELQHDIEQTEAFRAGAVEIAHVESYTGSYTNVHAGGTQMIVNFRSGPTPFQKVSWRSVRSQQIAPDTFRDKVVLIGITADSVKDVTPTYATPTHRFGNIYGVEMHAHEVSQLLSAVLDQRPMIQVWADGWEYLWIVAWGAIGILLGMKLRSLWKILMLLFLLNLALLAGSFGLLLQGWWIPVVPAILAFTLNGITPSLALIYRRQLDRQARLVERKLVLEQIFQQIHNGPLQDLKRLMTQAEQQQSIWVDEFVQLNQALRSIYDRGQSETLEDHQHFYLSHNQVLDLHQELEDLLYQVYCATLERSFAGFETLKVKLVEFKPMRDPRLTLAQKQSLCRFLEEALCNVGKHAIAPKRLKVICRQQGDQLMIQVSDNGQAPPEVADLPVQTRSSTQSLKRSLGGGFGSQQATNLAKQLGGKFKRYPNQPQGTICELTWSLRRRRFWWRYSNPN